MGAILQVWVDDATQKRLAFIAKELERAPEVLSESATAEAALEYFRHRKDDPAREVQQ